MYAATIGYFDGVHLGHRYLLSELRKIAHQCGMKSAVVTFTWHPALAIRGEQPMLLTTYDERVAYLRQTGIDEIFAFNFAAVQHMTAAEFMQVLHDRCGVDVLLLGYDHHFGSDHLHSLVEYDQVAPEGLTLFQLPKYKDLNVSSTLIRKAIAEGRVDDAEQMLGCPYSFIGMVVHGKQIGRTIGFPTANLLVSAEKLLPKPGVYRVQVTAMPKGAKEDANNALFTNRKAIMNIGSNPTVGGTKLTVEVFIPDFEGDLYGCRMRVDVLGFLRPEQHFDSIEALREQISADMQLLEHP